MTECYPDQLILLNIVETARSLRNILQQFSTVQAPDSGQGGLMKRIIFIFLMAVLAIPAIAMAGIIGPARVMLVDGDVMFRSPDAEEWLPASVNTPLDEGDAIWSPIVDPNFRTIV
jgi:hypothetical protein